MMSYLTLITLSLVFNNTVLVEGKGFKGYIFPKEYKNKYFERDTDKLFTPTIENIMEVEKLLNQKSKDIKRNKLSTENKCWNYNKLCKYNRQYFGEIDENGNKMIFVNFILKKSTPEYWNKDVVIVLDDSCDYVWTDKIKIDDVQN
ncbi:hypothetical protein [Flavobacterium sp.]|uniref:hypothetical protein n=1 Tax=Flavobacterium sp. TaxID=239 RepID=UPI0039E6466A